MHGVENLNHLATYFFFVLPPCPVLTLSRHPALDNLHLLLAFSNLHSFHRPFLTRVRDLLHSFMICHRQDLCPLQVPHNRKAAHSLLPHPPFEPILPGAEAGGQHHLPAVEIAPQHPQELRRMNLRNSPSIVALGRWPFNYVLPKMVSKKNIKVLQPR